VRRRVEDASEEAIAEDRRGDCGKNKRPRRRLLRRMRVTRWRAWRGEGKKISSVYECLQVFTSVYKLFTSCLQEQKPAWRDAGRCKTVYVFVYKIYKNKE